MAIISGIGRKSMKVRALFGGMYLFLICGAATMIYPFLLMISGSTKSAVDIKYFDAVPRFLHDDLWLYRKHVEGLFNESVLFMDIAYDSDDVSFERVEAPTGVNEPLLNEWLDFLQHAEIPFYAYTMGYVHNRVSRTIPLNLRLFKNWLKERHGKDLDGVNRALGTEYIGWSSVFMNPGACLLRREKPIDSTFTRAVAQFTQTVPLGLRYYFSPEGCYKKLFLKVQYSSKIEEYNRTHGVDCKSYTEVHLTRTVPENGTPKQREDWESFVRNTMALQWVRADASAEPLYREFLKAKHQKIETLNKNYGNRYRSFDDIRLIDEPPLSGMVISDWEAFIVGWTDPDTNREYKIPTEALRVHSVEFMFRDHLRDKYGDLAAVNAKLGADHASFDDIPAPQRDMHYAHFLATRKALRREFITRNYKAVAEYILLHGRGIFNTVVYCSLAILSALLVNPLAAYAMSRYKMPSTYKILLFLMCTMAFPPMVTGIPNFLMLRKLGLLNTFAALILPGMANGYSIFLLKGFFDAQPQELYESAQLDGAGEWVLFWHITMSLSKPILAVIALRAFTVAYSNFMFAFVVCQDEKMWTLMVWLYQLQQRSGQAVMYASLIIAAMPTFMIFLFCQNIIMRGIVVPSEK